MFEKDGQRNCENWSEIEFTSFGENAITSIFAKGWDSLRFSKKMVKKTAKIGQKMNSVSYLKKCTGHHHQYRHHLRLCLCFCLSAHHQLTSCLLVLEAWMRNRGAPAVNPLDLTLPPFTLSYLCACPYFQRFVCLLLLCHICLFAHSGSGAN